MKEYKITKERLEAMAEECPEVKEVLRKGFPEAFKEQDTLTDEFKEKARGHMVGLKNLIYNNLMKNDDKRAKWIIANLFYSSIPSEIDDELGSPYPNMREDY